MLKESAVPVQEKQDLGAGETIFYCLGFFANGLVNLGFSTYIAYFWTDVMIIPLAAISTIFVSSRFVDALTDIWCGFMVDRTKTKHGKARPWLLWMAAPAAISLLMLYFVPNFSETGKIVYAFVTYNLVAFFYGTCISLPLQSMTSLITSDPKKRLRLNMMSETFRTAATIFGNMYVLKAIAALGGGTQGYFRFFGLMGIGASLLILLTFFNTKERVVSTVKKDKPEAKLSVKDSLKVYIANKWWMLVTLLMALTMFYPALMGINMYYMTWIMGNPGLMGPFMSIVYMAMFGTLILVTPVIGRLGKINAGFMGMFIQVVGGLIPLFAPQNLTVIMISAAFKGAGPAILLGTRLAFMCDVLEYGEWKTGIRVEGLIFSGASFGQKLGTGMGAAVVTMMLGIGGYVGGAAVQSQAALDIIRFTFTWVHVFASVAVIIVLFFLRGLEKQMPQIMADLKTRKGIV